ncbi:heat shock protein beta-11-like [Discoglossus pictus]
MLCVHLPKKPSPDLLSLLLQPLWPVSGDLFSGMEQDMIRTVGEIKDTMRQMGLFHQKLLQEMSLHQDKTLPVQSQSQTTDGGFLLCLGEEDFSPQELTVKLLGRKLLVTGAKESKSEDGKGSFSYKCQIFRKESDLPQGVRAEELRCTVTPEGQLRIEAPHVASSSGQERTVPIQLAPAPESAQSPEKSVERKIED